MNEPTMLETMKIGDDTSVIVSYFPLPGFGVLPVNTFVIEAREPVLVDTGLAMLRDDYLAHLSKAIDPERLRWIWLTHTDADHTGNLAAVLDAAPNARLVTTFLGAGKLGLMGLPTDRAYLLNPGQKLDVGDRSLVAVKPPTYDAPETTGLFDEKTRTFFCADSFGALLDAPAERAEAIDAGRLRDGMTTWATIDAPWLGVVDGAAFGHSVREVTRLGASRILSSHLPPAERFEPLIETLVAAKDAPPFVGPDQAALEAMMADVTASNVA